MWRPSCRSCLPAPIQARGRGWLRTIAQGWRWQGWRWELKWRPRQQLQQRQIQQQPFVIQQIQHRFVRLQKHRRRSDLEVQANDSGGVISYLRGGHCWPQLTVAPTGMPNHVSLASLLQAKSIFLQQRDRHSPPLRHHGQSESSQHGLPLASLQHCGGGRCQHAPPQRPPLPR